MTTQLAAWYLKEWNAPGIMDHEHGDQHHANHPHDDHHSDHNLRGAYLHVWSIGIGIFAAEIAIVSNDPKTPEYYKSLIPKDLEITHVVVEVHRTPDS